jgi:COMPASS component SPP1
MPVSRTPVPGAENRALGEAEPDEAEEGTEDKLYCICETKYDDEKVMIACDRCDEWYHTSCVNIRDLQVDLVDQFICPLCVEKNPHLDLRTTWKRRCMNGLKQHDPNSPDACHKPARGAFSKYCSDECGVQYMHMRISLWVENGGNRDRLWETLKNAERREGVVVSAHAIEGQFRPPIIAGDQVMLAIVPPKISKADRELARLRARLESLVQKREALKAEMDIIAWREKVTELAIQHADTIEQCGWDQRLCFGEEDVAEFGASVLESYEENHAQADLDGTQEEAEWWCTGKKKCDRHSGWQKLRVADVEFDKETKDQALQKLTKLEREIRKRVEDILDPHAHLDKTKMLEPSSPRVPVLSRSTLNGQPKHKPNGDQTKKGKKRKE